MKMTVKDCLELDVFKPCVIASGNRNLKNHIRSVSVLDAADSKTAVKNNGVKDQLVLTSFYGMSGDIKAQVKVVKALADKDSIFYFYQKINNLRKGNEIIRYGSYKQFFPKDKNVWVYERAYNDKKYLIVASYTDKAATFTVPDEWKGQKAEVLLTNYADGLKELKDATLKPYEAIVFEVK